MTVNEAIEIIKRKEKEIDKLLCAMKDTYEPDDEITVPRYMGVLLHNYMENEIEDLKNRTVEDNE